MHQDLIDALTKFLANYTITDVDLQTIKDGFNDDDTVLYGATIEDEVFDSVINAFYKQSDFGLFHDAWDDDETWNKACELIKAKITKDTGLKYEDK